MFGIKLLVLFSSFYLDAFFCKKKSVEIAKLLIENGADIGAMDKDSCDALHYGMNLNFFFFFSYSFSKESSEALSIYSYFISIISCCFFVI